MTDLETCKAIEERFWNNINKVSHRECWNWNGYCDNDGYGKVQFRVNKEKIHERAHRVSLCLSIQQNIPSVLIVRHSCDNPRCVNPAHLLVGSHEENVQDRVNRYRSARGEQNGRSKLKATQVDHINSKYAEFVQKEARIYGVSPKLIRELHRGKIWKHI